MLGDSGKGRGDDCCVEGSEEDRHAEGAHDDCSLELGARGFGVEWLLLLAAIVGGHCCWLCDLVFDAGAEGAVLEGLGGRGRGRSFLIVLF